jgi:hypothetical protein
VHRKIHRLYFSSSFCAVDPHVRSPLGVPSRLLRHSPRDFSDSGTGGKLETSTAFLLCALGWFASQDMDASSISHVYLACTERKLMWAVQMNFDPDVFDGLFLQCRLDFQR